MLCLILTTINIRLRGKTSARIDMMPDLVASQARHLQWQVCRKQISNYVYVGRRRRRRLIYYDNAHDC